jgi:hypothetical protein
MRARDRLRPHAAATSELCPYPAKAFSGRSSLRAVAGLASVFGRLLNATRQRVSGFSHARQCGDDVFPDVGHAIPPPASDGGIPQRTILSSRSPPA